MGRSCDDGRHVASAARHAGDNRLMPSAQKTGSCRRARGDLDPPYLQKANFRVLGEAEGIINDFIAAWEAGTREGLFAAEKFTVDVTKSPIPRFDLLNF